MEFTLNGQPVQVSAGLEIVLSLGALQTPKVLMQSGVGDREQLKRFGIALVHHSPSVGRNLHDHITFGCVWEATGVPMPLAPRGQVTCFWKTDASLESPDALLLPIPLPYVSPENSQTFPPPAAAWSLCPGVRTKSRGAVYLTGPNTLDPLSIQTDFFADPADMQAALKAMALCREIGNSHALKGFAKGEAIPGNLGKTELENFIRNGAGTLWHQSGTAKMGRDETSVVDGSLKVYGTEGLRIADASILPRATTGPTMAPCVVIGERAADILKEQYGS